MDRSRMTPWTRRAMILALAAAPMACAPPRDAAPARPTPIARQRTNRTSNMRAGPSTRSAVVRIVPNGEQVSIFARQGGWLRVSWGGSNGWIHSSLLGPRRRAAPSPTETEAEDSIVVTPCADADANCERESPSGPVMTPGA